MKKILSFDHLEKKVVLSTSPTVDVVTGPTQAETDLYYNQYNQQLMLKQTIEEMNRVSNEQLDLLEKALAPATEPSAPVMPVSPTPSFYDVWLKNWDAVIQSTLDAQIPLMHP